MGHTVGMQQACKQCSAPFEITDEDRTFYEHVSPTFGGKAYQIPPPTLCIDCREQRRAVQLNELFLYKRKCDLTGKEIISNFHPDSPYKVYEQEVWYSDQWDPLTYGRDFDFSRPFFEQYAELCLAVPHPNLFTGYQYDENCEYTNYAGKNQNCYLIFDSDENRDCYYSYSLNGCESCMDCYRIRKSELCYESVDSISCYNCVYVQECENCWDSMFLKNCIGCKNCIMCSNLRSKEYYVENKSVSKEEFEKIRAMITTQSSIQSAKDRFEKLKLEYPQKYIHGTQNENVLGDYLVNSKNAHWCFDSEDLWDCKYIFQGFMPLKDSMDLHECGEGEKLYECSVCGYNANNIQFTANCLDQISNVLYSSYCFHSSNLFGCIGLRQEKYCIFNKQYTDEEYERLVPKIIEHMKQVKEWGEFFPITLSPFAYNESIAQDYYPLTKEEVSSKGYGWRDPDEKEYQPATCVLPDGIQEVSDDITKEVLACENPSASSGRPCGRNYRIIAQELKFYRDKGMPLPRMCFLCRHHERMAKRNPRKLWDHTCGKCQKEIQTTYAPERPEIVYCEECYLDAVY